MSAAVRTESFPQWRGGSCWHHRQAGYSGHIVQVVSDFGELVAVSGSLRLVRQAEGGEVAHGLSVIECSVESTIKELS